jgi:glycosyltransferase involved in cell wall biosynthesis
MNLHSSAMAEPSAVSVLIPAFNEAESIGSVLSALRALAAWREILVVDDGSSDGTAERARAAGARVITHPYNKGNGAAVKSGIRAAAGEYILIMDADGQHTANDAHRLVGYLGEYDLVVGARAPDGQASAARRLGNHALNWVASYLTGRSIPDLTSGMRAARADCLREFLYLLPNGFSTPTTTTLACVKAGYSVKFEPIDTKARIGQSKIRFMSDGATFFLILLKVITVFSPLRIFVPISAGAFLLGTGYAVWTALTQHHITNSSVLLIVLAVVIFLVGLVSEQISTLRSEGPR